MVLVTGASGFIGSSLVRELVLSGESVRALYRRKIPKDATGLDGPVEWVQADILDTSTLADHFRGISQVYHVAGKVSFLPADRSELMKINVEGTANVVNLALDLGIKKLIHVSSAAAIGRPTQGQTIDESCKWEDSPNNSNYALSKYLGEMEVWRAIGEGLDGVIVNPSIVLGPGGDKDSCAAMLSFAYRQFPWYTEGINGFVGLADTVRAMRMLMQSNLSSRRFILNGDNWSYRELFTTMAGCLRRRPPYRKAGAKMSWLVWRAAALKYLFTGKAPLVTRETVRTAQLKVYYDHSLILEALPGFRFSPLEQIIQQMCERFLESQESHCSV